MSKTLNSGVKCQYAPLDGIFYESYGGSDPLIFKFFPDNKVIRITREFYTKEIETVFSQLGVNRLKWLEENVTINNADSFPITNYIINEDETIKFEHSHGYRTWSHVGKLITDNDLELTTSVKWISESWQKLYRRHNSEYDILFEATFNTWRENLEHQRSRITYHKDAEIEFFAHAYNTDDEFYLEIGDEMLYETDLMDDNEVIEQGKKRGYLDDVDDDNAYLLEDGSINVDYLRQTLLEWEKEYPPSSASPSGRAYEFFESRIFELRKEIDITIIDGASPGNDWQGVIVKGIESLSNLQRLLREKSNIFIINQRYPEW